METFRSEHSEDGLSTSCFGNSTSSVLSFSSQSGGSFDSRSARSDFLNNYEQKFRARKAEKKKKTEREMRAWIPDPAVLKRREWTSKKRSREQMKGVLNWYSPSSESTKVHPLFGAFGSAESNDHVTEQQRALEEEACESFALTLVKQMNDLKQKVLYVERHVATSEFSPSVVRHKRGNMIIHKRRPSREQLAPLRNEHAPPQAFGRSASHVSVGYQQQLQRTNQSRPRDVATGKVHNRGVNLRNCMPLNQLHAVDEDAAEMGQFLTLHRRKPSSFYLCVICGIQTAETALLRGENPSDVANVLANGVWRIAFAAKQSAALARKYLLAWREEVRAAIQLHEIEFKLFRDAETQSELPKLVVNLVFMSTDQGGASRKSIQRVFAQQQARGEFFNSAFASVMQVPGSHRGRVQRMRLQHMKARDAIAKKIVQRMFLLWKKVHQESKRVGLNAQLCIKHAARLAFGSRPVWVGEKLLLVSGIWCRYATFTRCKRSGRPLPQYTQALPQWDIWAHNYQEREIRKVKATTKAPLARMRRFFRRLHTFSDRSIEKREHMEKATRHYVVKITRVILCNWCDEIAEPATNKKLCRFVFFNRELNVSRLEPSQWRVKVHRIIYIWMDAKHHVNRWKTFDAWKNYCKKRRLFETLRFHCEKVCKRHLLLGILNVWKAFVWKQEDKFLEDRLQLSAWDAYEELSPFSPKLFYGCYSDAAAIFGGVETKRGNDDDEKDDTVAVKLSYNSVGIRQFQSILVQGSVFEVQNTVLRSNHLVNAVDDVSGNTPLHAVMSVEDYSHRIDILSLLLSEGAVTWNRPNCYGLTPKQLAPDADTTQLLEQGIYAFYATQVRRAEVDRKSMDPPQGSSREPDKTGTMSGEQRLMWCMVTLLSSEWVRGLRIAGGVEVREWHSVLKEELWLRQERMIFASTSEFSPAILRCRAFLNGMKKKLTRSAPHILQQQIQKALRASPGAQTSDEAAHDASKPLPVRQNQSRALHSRGSLRGQQYASMLTRIVAATDRDAFVKPSQDETERNHRAASLGELEPYAQFLLTPTLDCEPAERTLVHSFVGVLFSLEFSVDDVLVEAFQLEDMCAALEYQVWTLHEQLVRAQWKILALSDDTAKVPLDPSLLRCFSSEFEMDIFFGRQLFVLHVDRLLLKRERKSAGVDPPPVSTSLENVDKDHGNMSSAGDADIECERDALIKEVGALLAKFQRKMRRIEKKKTALQEHLVASESRYRATLVSATRSVREISIARFVVESAKLKMTALLLKRSELESAIADLEATKGHLVSGNLDKLQRSANGLDTLELVTETTHLLEEECARCTQLFRNNDLIAHHSKDTNNREIASQCLEARQLFKRAKAALDVLFVANLFRCSCCWLAENMTPPDKAEDEADEAVPASAIEREKNPLLPRNASMMRRRRSVSNARKVFETLHRGSIVTEAAERLAALMKETYASSGGLLFEMERVAIQEQEKQRQEQENCIVPTIQEMNLITGQPEEPPKHLLDVQSVGASDRASQMNFPHDNLDAPVRRNRKREELRKAIVEHQLRRMTPGYQITDDGDDEDGEANRSSDKRSLLPSIHSTSVKFGNFVSSTATLNTSEDPASDLSVAANGHSPSTAAYHVWNAESMWKRDAKQTSEHGVALAAKPPSDIFTSAEDESAFNDSLRVLSASRDRRPSSRQQSAGKTTTPQQHTPTEFEQHDDVRHTQSVQRTSMVQPGATNIAMGFSDRQGSAITFSTIVESCIAREAESDGNADTLMLSAADQDVEGTCEEHVEREEALESPQVLENEISTVQPQPETGISNEEMVAETDAEATEEEALDECFLRIRTTASMHDALIAPVAVAAVDARSVSATAKDQKQHERHAKPQEENNPQDMFSGSRFSAFIKWEKKDAAVNETLGPIPRIFQDPASPRGSYTQGERDCDAFAGRVGDGIASYLNIPTDDEDGASVRWEVHFEGAGPALCPCNEERKAMLLPFVNGEMQTLALREFLGSEHLNALGIPTTRTASVVAVPNEAPDANDATATKAEPSAIVMRVARSFLSFGSFEIFNATKSAARLDSNSENDSAEMMRRLLDFTIKHYYPEVVVRLDSWSTTTQHSFAMMLKQQTRAVDDADTRINPMCAKRTWLEQELSAFDDVFSQEFYRLMREKLGLLHKFFPIEDKALVDDLTKEFTETGTDFTRAFRSLIGVTPFDARSHLMVVDELVGLSQSLDQAKRRAARMNLLPPAKTDAERHEAIRFACTGWVRAYANRLKEESDSVSDAANAMYRLTQMHSTNPAVVLRDYIVQKAVECAREGEYQLVAHIVGMLVHPFDAVSPNDRVYAYPTVDF
ncbi:Iq motif, ef-hand binding site, partial [Globisporangium splendens]